MHMTRQIYIDRSPGAIWPHGTKLEEELRWRRPYVIELSADGDPLSAGTRIEGTTRAFGLTDTYVNEVTEVDPPHRLAWRGVNASGALIGTRGSYELEPENEGSLFRLKMQYEPQGWSGRIQAPILGLILRRIGDRFVRQLKTLSEREAPAQ